MARAQCKPTESLQAYDFYLRALAIFYRFTREGNIEAFKLAKTARSLDPNFARPFALAADCLIQRWAFGWSTGSAEDVEEARRLARRALEIDKNDPSALALAGMALALFVGEVEDGAALLTRAITFDPNLALARIWNGWAQLGLGNQAAAIEQFQIGLRLSPLDPRIFVAQAGRRSFLKYLTNVRLFEAVSANTFTGHSCSALTAQFIRPRSVGMVLAHPADAETDLAVRVDHETSLTG